MIKKRSSIRRIILITISLGIFILGLYLGSIIAVLSLLNRSIQDHDLDQAALRSKQILLLTNSLKKTSWYPLQLTRNASELIITVNQIKQTSENIISHIIDPQPNDQLEQDWNQFSQYYIRLTAQLRTINQHIQAPEFANILGWVGRKEQVRLIQAQAQQLLDTLITNQDIINIMPQITGLDNPKPVTYTILLQNNMELRPTGGFMGSYVQLTFNQGQMVGIEAQDIYVPDGAITGHVNPPEPIQKAFKQGWWRLRDSNWDPDFPTAVQAIRWFFEKGGVDVGQGVIAINLEVVEDILNHLGSIELTDYNQQITSDNLYAVAQYEAERDFFAGSTQKRDFLQSLINSIFYQNQSISFDQLHQIISSINQHLTQKNIQINVNNPQIQSVIEQKHWDGKLVFKTQDNTTNDFFFSVDANLGANKANCCIEKVVTQTVKEDPDDYQISSTITYTNHSPVPTPKPPKYWGGDYENYTRIILPSNAELTHIQVSNNDQIKREISITNRDHLNLTEYGFFVLVPHNETVVVDLEHIIPKKQSSLTYQNSILRQSGIAPYTHTVDFITPQQILTKVLSMDQDHHIKF